MRSKTFMSKINLQRGKLTVENRKSREKKRICSKDKIKRPMRDRPTKTYTTHSRGKGEKNTK